MTFQVEKTQIAFSTAVIESIKNTIGATNIETGGILGQLGKQVDQFVFDPGLVSLRDEYIPNVEILNQTLVEWQRQEILFAGLIHSHQCRSKLSYADLEYAKAILQTTHIMSLYMHLFILGDNSIVSYMISSI